MRILCALAVLGLASPCGYATPAPFDYSNQRLLGEKAREVHGTTRAADGSSSRPRSAWLERGQWMIAIRALPGSPFAKQCFASN